jgi:hypothetical protein
LGFKKDTTEMKKKAPENSDLGCFSDNLIWLSIFNNQPQFHLNTISSNMCFSNQCCIKSSNNPLGYMINMRLNFDLFQNRLLLGQSADPVVPPDPAKKLCTTICPWLPGPLIWSQLKLPQQQKQQWS